MDQKRFILAMVLSAVILFVWQMWFMPRQPEPTGDQTAAEKTVDAEGDAAEAEATDAAPPAEADDAEPAEAAELAEVEPAQVIEPRTDVLASDLLRAEITNVGARVKSARLINNEQYEARGDLVGFPEEVDHLPYSTEFLDGNIAVAHDAAYELVEDNSVKADGEGYSKLFYRYTDPKRRFTVDKIYQVDPKLPYTVDLNVVVTNLLDDVNLIDTPALDIYGWKDPNVETSWLDFMPNEISGVCRLADDTERETYSGIEEALTFTGQVQWGAVDTRYFLLSAVPEGGANRCTIESAGPNLMRTRLAYQSFSIAPGQTWSQKHLAYMGPKDGDIMETVGANLEESVDYGIFAFIARPLHWALDQIYEVAGNWGLAILILTILIRALIWPINMKAYSSMERMKQVQPMLTEVREKYKDDQARMTEETMKLFRENNVNPAGGCLPMLLQMPILYGLYVMIYNSVELYHADFILWYDNLAAPDPYYVLPILMGVTMFAQQSMSTVTTQNKQQAIMMKVMPVMFTAFMLFLPSGLVLYYACSLLIGVGQQFYVRQKFQTEEESATT